jgi:hypothetical protein
MGVKRIFTFPIGLLSQEADYILDAAVKYAADIDPRLPANFVTDQRTLLDTLRTRDTGQKTSTATLGGHTISQNEALEIVNDLVARAKESAKRAFKGEEVKLRNEFQVGINAPKDMASLLQRARIVRDSCANAGNTGPLAAKGWLAADTTALTDAIDALDTADDTQEVAKGSRLAATNDRNGTANDLYEGLLTIQNAANIEWPERVETNTGVRAEFRFGFFPPRRNGNGNGNGNGNHQPTPPTPPPA